MHKLKENAEKELKAIEEKGLNTSNLDNAYKLTEIIKGIDKIKMMEEGEGEYSQRRGYSREGGYSQEGRGYSREGRGYSREDYEEEDDYANGNSYRRGRNKTTGRYMSRNNYSRLSGEGMDMESYRDRKMEYSNCRDGASKERMLDALEDFMSGVHGMLKQMFRDSDCQEEREIIQKYAREIAKM